MIRALMLLSSLLACGETESTTETPAPAPAVQAPAPAPAPAVQVDSKAAEQAVAPSPLKLQQEMTAAGMDQSLGSLVPASRFARETTNPDTVAIRTGILISDAVLAGPADSKEAFLARLDGIHAGLKTMGMGAGRLSDIEDYIVEVRNDTASRADFVAELDQVISEGVPEEGWGPGDTTGPLLQAGAWLAATNLVAQAVVAKGDDAAANALLKRPGVAAYFLDWTRSEGGKKANPATIEQVEKALTAVHEATSKDALTVADAQAIVDATGGLFGWL